ncbi:MAG: hydroxymethylglutaryl-CoA synthase family protein [Thermoplasmata archaeon]|nr:hydroxymethylglutaryl-CoA synthase family protein [Thermoplasmata archaeon]
MVGIISYGVYLPHYQMTGDVLGKAWGKPSGKGAKVISNYDEDSLTMAVAASLECLEDLGVGLIDGLYFSSTTPPYGEKMNASIVATALDLNKNALTMDIGSSLRSSTNALKAALDTVSSGSRKNVLVAASDSRLAEPGSYLEPFLGDGASAFLIGVGNPIADIIDHFSVFDGFPDVWRKQDERFLRHDDVRYSRSEVYARNMKDAVEGLFSAGNYQTEDFSKAVLFSPDPRSHGHLAKSLGFSPEQVQDPLLDKTGMIGAGHSLMMLAAALDQAKPDDLILFASYGDGADAFSVRATKFIEGFERDTLPEIERKRKSVGSYTRYLTFRELVGDYQMSAPFSAIPLLRREEDLNIRLHGKKCKGCGTVMTLALKICPHCRSSKDFEDVKLSKRGKIVTYSQEYYYPTPEPPVTMAVIDLDGGGRILAQMTDSQAEDVEVEMPVELTFRKLHTGGGFVNYSWKCRPIRKGGDQ